MKKVLSFITVLCLVLSLVACAKTPVANNESVESTAAEKEEQQSLILVTNAEFPPYEYEDNGKFVGIDIDCAEAIANKLGMKLEVMNVAFDVIINTVTSGKGDFAMAGMTVTEDRMQFVDFSHTYQTAIQNIIVNEDSSITSIDDLAGKKIGVVTGFTGDIYATDDFGDENIERFKNGLDAVQSLIAGKIDCVMVDDQVAKNYVSSNKGIKVLDTPYAEEEYAACVKKGNTELLNKINAVIDELKSSGELQKIVAKYIKD